MAHVLGVEDDSAIRESTCEALESKGFRVASGCDGAEALTLVRRGLRPSVLLLAPSPAEPSR